MAEKNYEELEMKDDFMFGKVMANRELCRQTLETLLGIEIESVEYPERQKSIQITSEGKSVRLDVYVQDSRENVYDAEVQQLSKDKRVNRQLPQRSRYYQGMIDLNLLEKGGTYQELKDCYILFICTFDPFGRNLYRYTFQNICLEDKELLLEDKSIKVFFNTKGTMGDVPEGVRSLLRYLDTKQADNELTRRLDQEVERIRHNEKWRREYMKSLLYEMEVLEQGRLEGLEEGEERMGRLIGKLIEEGNTMDIQLVASNTQAREEYYKKYGI